MRLRKRSSARRLTWVSPAISRKRPEKGLNHVELHLSNGTGSWSMALNHFFKTPTSDGPQATKKNALCRSAANGWMPCDDRT